jgi:hypothetical protein
MTISKERLNKIVNMLATQLYWADKVPAEEEHIQFAHALLKAVEQESKVVGHGMFNTEGKCYAISQHRSSMCVGGLTFTAIPLIALPLVEGD